MLTETHHPTNEAIKWKSEPHAQRGPCTCSAFPAYVLIEEVAECLCDATPDLKRIGAFLPFNAFGSGSEQEGGDQDDPGPSGPCFGHSDQSVLGFGFPGGWRIFPSHKKNLPCPDRF